MLNQLLNTNVDITLSCGIILNVHQLTLKKWEPALGHYAKLLEVLALMSEYQTDEEITNEFVSESMPSVMASIAITDPLSREMLIAFLNLFITDETLNDEILDSFTQDDFKLLWDTIYSNNSGPFVSRRVEMKKMGVFKALQHLNLETLASFMDSIKSESTQEQITLPLTTP